MPARRGIALPAGAGLIVAAIAGCSAAPSRVSFSQSSATVDAYDFVEITAEVSWPRARSPFEDAALSGTFRSSDGKHEWHVPGFCDSAGGDVFRIRFMPPAPGDYAYTVEYRQGRSTREFRGTLRATDGRRRGPIRVDAAHPFHFVWEGTGEHYFFNGTTAYWLIGWRDEAIIRAALGRLHRLSVNRVRVTIAGRSYLMYGEPAIAGYSWTNLIEPWPAAHPEDVYHPGFDYTRFNLEYWTKFDHALRCARDNDIIVSLVLDMNDGRVHPVAGSQDERRFIQYAVARFSAFSNITWDLGDDLSEYRDDAWTHATGTLIKTLDPYRHLATSHPGNHGNDHQDRTAPWFDFTSFQDWNRNQHAFMLAERDAQRRTGRIIPQTNEEYGYEDHYPLWAPRPDGESADALRHVAWDIAMAGGYQTTGESARRGTNVWPDTGGGWLNGRGDESMTMLEGYAHMKAFFESFAWWETEPHDELVDAGSYCLAKPGEIYAVYLPKGGPVTVRLGPGTFRGTWLDPKTGRRVPSDRTEAGDAHVVPPPGADEWALLFVREPARPETP